jgi:hypothetical protein
MKMKMKIMLRVASAEGGRRKWDPVMEPVLFQGPSGASYNHEKMVVVELVEEGESSRKRSVPATPTMVVRAVTPRKRSNCFVPFKVIPFPFLYLPNNLHCNHVVGGGFGYQGQGR